MRLKNTSRNIQDTFQYVQSHFGSQTGFKLGIKEHFGKIHKVDKFARICTSEVSNLTHISLALDGTSMFRERITPQSELP